MPNRPTSMQNQSPLQEAQDSVDKANHAAKQAQSHPTSTMVTQAQNALNKAQRSVAQTQSDDNQMAVEQTEMKLEHVEDRLSQAQSAAISREGREGE